MRFEKVDLGHGVEKDVDVYPFLTTNTVVSEQIGQMVGPYHQLVTGSPVNAILRMAKNLERATKVFQAQGENERRAWYECQLGSIVAHAVYFAQLRMGSEDDGERMITYFPEDPTSTDEGAADGEQRQNRRQKTGVVRSQSVEEISTHILKLKDSRLEIQRMGEGLGYSDRDLDKALRKLLDDGSKEVPRPNKRSSENKDKRVDDLVKRLRVMEEELSKQGNKTSGAQNTTPGPLNTKNQRETSGARYDKKEQEKKNCIALGERITDDIGSVTFAHFVKAGRFKEIISLVDKVKEEKKIKCVNGVLFDVNLEGGKCPRPDCKVRHKGGELMDEEERRELLLEVLGA